jgi:hypothetical protein
MSSYLTALEHFNEHRNTLKMTTGSANLDRLMRANATCFMAVTSARKLCIACTRERDSPWLRWILVQCAMIALRCDQHLKSFYERLKSKKGSAKAIVATAKEILVIIWCMLTRRELYRHMNRNCLGLRR